MKFKNWTIPGPEVPGGIAPEPGETLDAMSGHFKIFQYEKGHRFSTDDLLAAWYGLQACPRPERVLDLGSGIGSVGMVAAWRCPSARVISVEAQERSHRLALKSIAYNGLGARWDARLGDFREGVLRADENFDLVLTSPPYFPLGTGIESDDSQKLACRFELRGDVGDYLRVGARRLAPGGVVAGVFPWATRERALECAAAREALRLVRMRPVVLRDGDEPLLFVYAFSRQEDLPVGFRAFEEPALRIRDAKGEITPEYAAIKLSIGFPP